MLNYSILLNCECTLFSFGIMSPRGISAISRLVFIIISFNLLTEVLFSATYMAKAQEGKLQQQKFIHLFVLFIYLLLLLSSLFCFTTDNITFRYY